MTARLKQTSSHLDNRLINMEARLDTAEADFVSTWADKRQAERARRKRNPADRRDIKYYELSPAAHRSMTGVIARQKPGRHAGHASTACILRAYIRSKIPAAPIPVPTHIVTMPYFRFLRRNACTTVAERIAPVAPNGCPSAIAPPIGLILDGSRPRS